MEISANTSIFLCAGVPFDNTYEHVRLFENMNDRLSYFNTLTVKRVTGCTYQRQNKYISVPFLYDEIANCDYLYFQNDTDGKYYFAFITAIEYQNPSLSRVYFEIDAFQTWFTSDSLRESFVEREHVNDDSYGANLVEESLETGEYVYHYDIAERANLSEIWYVMGVTEIVNATGIPSAPEQGGGVYLGIYSALNYIAFPPSETDTLENYVRTYSENGKADAIYTIFMCPKFLLPGVALGTYWLPTDTTITGIVVNLNKPSTIDGYIPKNNKLFTFPYSLCVATDYTTAHKELKFEYSQNDNNKIRVEIRKDLTPTGQAVCIPYFYNGNGQYSGADSFKMGGWPQCAWITNVYENWLAQNIASIGVGSVTSAISSGLAIVTGQGAGAIGAGVTAFSNIANTMAALYQKQIIPDSLKGNSGNGNAWIMTGDYDLYLMPVSIRAKYAKRIDDYFTHYGYKVLEFKQPNITGRRYWNFVKLTECNINLNAPIEATEKIKGMFLNGVTIWHTNDIKNYSLNNEIIGG